MDKEASLKKTISRLEREKKELRNEVNSFVADLNRSKKLTSVLKQQNDHLKTVCQKKECELNEFIANYYKRESELTKKMKEDKLAIEILKKERNKLKTEKIKTEKKKFKSCVLRKNIDSCDEEKESFDDLKGNEILKDCCYVGKKEEKVGEGCDCSGVIEQLQMALSDANKKIHGLMEQVQTLSQKNKTLFIQIDKNKETNKKFEELNKKQKVDKKILTEKTENLFSSSCLYFKGEVVKGQKSGNCVYKTADVHREGFFKDDKLNGEGILTYLYPKKILKGNFIDDIYTGNTIRFNNITYKGGVINNKMSGKGYLEFNNGLTFEGEFLSDKILEQSKGIVFNIKTGKEVKVKTINDVLKGDKGERFFADFVNGKLDEFFEYT